MKPLIIPIDEIHSAKELLPFLNKSDFWREEKPSILFQYREKPDDFRYAGLLFYLYGLIRQKRRFQRSEAEDLAGFQSFENAAVDAESLAQNLEEQMGVNVELAPATPQELTEGDIDSIFGLWKDYPITLENLRDREWPHKE